jgi:hypothetical protein
MAHAPVNGTDLGSFLAQIAGGVGGRAGRLTRIVVSYAK